MAANRKSMILNTALHLFVSNGVDGTSTRSISQEAGVSEGLIFRHFGSKQGLVDAIVDWGVSRIGAFVEAELVGRTPRELIGCAVEIPLKLFREDREIWDFITHMKLKDKRVARSLSETPSLSKLKDLLSNAFNRLGYPRPDLETASLLIWISGLAKELVIGNAQRDWEEVVLFQKAKYEAEHARHEQPD